MEKKIQYSLRLLSMMLFLAITLVSAKLEAIYDNGDEYKLFIIGKPLILACTYTDNTKIIWKKNEKDVKEVITKGHYEVKEAEGKFIINKALENDAGNYSCHVDNEVKKFDVWPQIYVKVPSNSYVVENEKLEIICTVRGLNPIISWKFQNTSGEEQIISSDDDDERIRLESHDGIEDSKLIIDHSVMSDRGVYTCFGTSTVMNKHAVDPVSSESMVRVKDKLAALWPFLGICAEVFILCTIILIYEKRRNKTDLEESDTDQSPDQLK